MAADIQTKRLVIEQPLVGITYVRFKELSSPLPCIEVRLTTNSFRIREASSAPPEEEHICLSPEGAVQLAHDLLGETLRLKRS